MTDQETFLARKLRKIGQHPRRFYRTTIWSLSSPNVVFLWIPKTAGTSLFTWLEREMKMVRLNRKPKYMKAFRNRGAVTFGHYDYMALRETGIVSDDYDTRAFKFCISRDPYDRAISLYYYACRTGMFTGMFEGAFAQFLADVRESCPPVGLYNVKGLSQANPQVDWITDREGALLADKIYPMENLAELEGDFRQRFGIAGPGLGHSNKTARDQSRQEILQAHNEVVPLIREIYAKDFEALGYPVEVK